MCWTTKELEQGLYFLKNQFNWCYTDIQITNEMNLYYSHTQKWDGSIQIN